MILTDREIRIALGKGQVILDPPPAADAYSSTAVDLTLDPTARRFKYQVGDGYIIDPGSDSFEFHKEIDFLTEAVGLCPTTQAPGLILQRNVLLLAWTRGSLELPVNSRLAARVEGKSSLARIGIGIHITAPTIHAGFIGQLQLEILNHGPAPVTLRAGMPICQIIFESTLGTPEVGYTGQFSGQQSH